VTDPTEDLFAGLDAPRPLPAELRSRLESDLLQAAGTPTAVPLGDELDQRLEAALTDPLAAVLAGVDAPRTLSPQLRERLETRLTRRRRRAQTFLAAAAVVLVAVALAVVVTAPGSSRHRPAAGPSPAAGAPGGSGAASTGAGTIAGGTGVATTGGAAGAASLPAAKAPSAVPAPTVAADGLAFADNAAPGVRGVRPNAGPLDGGTAVTVTGRGLSAVVAVVFGNRVATSFTVVSDTTVRAITPVGASPATVDVVVRLRSGASYRLSAAFGYLARPVVASLTPSSGATAGGTWVTVHGSALSRTSAVVFGDAAASRVEVVSDTELRALSPTHLPGPVDVKASTPGGTSAASPGDRYTYLP
jgi:hypothetical protein